MRAHEVGRSAEAAKRAKALHKAHALGLSYEALAEGMGVSRQRVRQMEQGKGK
jgi:transcriptional regulator with XRE-family HTH domain